MTPEQEKWACLCHLCFPNAREFCELIPGCYLYENEGQWGLMCQPGHTENHAILKFPDKPWPDPDPLCEYNEGDEKGKLSDQWIDTVSEWDTQVLLSPCDGHFLVESCKKSGWGTKTESYSHKNLLFWLYDFAGKKLIELGVQ